MQAASRTKRRVRCIRACGGALTRIAARINVRGRHNGLHCISNRAQARQQQQQAHHCCHGGGSNCRCLQRCPHVFVRFQTFGVLR